MGIETAIIGGAALGLGGALFGASASKKAANTQASAASKAAQTQSDAALKAANIQAQSADKALAVQQQMYNQSRADMAPWRQAGQNALTTLQQQLKQGPGVFKASEGYNWTLGQGLQGAQRAASAGGANRSGAHIKAATEYAEGLASTEYDNFLNRWYKSLTPYQSLAGIGQNSAAIQGGNAMQAGSNLAGIYQQQGQAMGAGYLGAGQAMGAGYLGAGQAQAAGQMGQANTLASGLNWAGQNMMGYGMLNAMQPQSYIQPTMGSTNQLAAWNPNTTGAYYNW